MTARTTAPRLAVRLTARLVSLAAFLAALLAVSLVASGCHAILDPEELKTGDRCMSDRDCGSGMYCEKEQCIDDCVGVECGESLTKGLDCGSCDGNATCWHGSCEDLDCAGGRMDLSTGLCWQHPRASGSYRWQEAIDYCENLTLAGHSNWRLPSRDDFIDLLGGCAAA